MSSLAASAASPAESAAAAARTPDCPLERAAMIARAKAMVPVLRERAARTEALRRVPDETIEDFHQAGFFRVLQPAVRGGYEFHPSIYLDVAGELGRGCGSSAWVLVNLLAHHQFLAIWDLRAQNEVWDVSPDALIGSSFIFTAGRAERVAGGFRLSGRWPFSSGIDPCAWVMLSGTATGDESQTESRYFLLPRDDYEIIDTWHVIGLRGTGSKDVACKDVFVPEHRTLRFDDMVNCTAPGFAIHPGVLFKLPMPATGGYVLLSAIYGTARGAVDDYVESIKSRIGRISGKGLADLTAVQTRVAEAEACLDTAALIIRNAFDETMEKLVETPVLDAQYAIKQRVNGAFCAQLCERAVDLVFAGSGGAGLFESNPIQRAWRDVHAGIAQFILQWDVAAPAAGRVRLGLPSGIPGID